MTSQPLSLRIRGLLSAGLILLAASDALAQVQGQGRGGGGGGIIQGGGGGGGGTGANSVRQYNNSTMVGDAMITSDMDSRRLIVVTDDATNDNIKSIIASLDKPKPQVLINVVFLQVTHDKDLDLGAEATYVGKIAISTNPTGTATTKFGLAGALADTTSFGGFYSILGRDVDATIHALAAVNKTEILSRPSILTRSNQQATIMVGQTIPIVTNSQVSALTNALTNTYTYTDIGIILRVTPFITAEGMVEMIVSPQISSLSATTIESHAVIDKRSADTVVVTPSDKTVVIGGLISTQKTDAENKVPLLGDIPLLGYAFKRKITKNEKTELLIFLTPHVVKNPEDLSRLADDERAKLDMTSKSFEKNDMGKYLPPH